MLGIDLHDSMNMSRSNDFTTLIARKDGTIISMHDNLDAAIENVLCYYHQPMYYVLDRDFFDSNGLMLDVKSSVACFDIYFACKASLSEGMPRHIGDVKSPILDGTAFIFPIYNAALEYAEGISP